MSNSEWIGGFNLIFLMAEKSYKLLNMACLDEILSFKIKKSEKSAIR